MGVVSPAFFCTTLAAALAMCLLGTRLPRDILLIAASTAFIFTIGGHPLATVPFWVLVFGGYIVVKNAHHAKAPIALVGLAVLVVLAWWWLRTKAPELLGLAPTGVAVFGLSYAMFRIIHLAVDARDDELGGPLDLRSYLCYLIFFPNYLAGPVQRYQHFAPQVAAQTAQPAHATDWLAAGVRSAAGLFKCTVLAGAALQLHHTAMNAVSAQPTNAAWLLAAAAMAFAAYLYFSFTGYMDLAISAGRVLGVQIPENFDQPVRAKNFLDFWSRWHITLSDWFRFYVFNPTLKAMLATIDRPKLAPYLGAVGYFLAFFLMGIWHGRTPALILYGLVLGGGVSINKLFQVWAAKRLGRRGYQALCERTAYQLCSQALALGYFVVALCFLWKLPADMMQVNFAAMSAGALTVLVACLLVAAATRWPGWSSVSISGIGAVVLTVIQTVAAAAWLWWNNGATTELMYQWL